MKPRDLEIVYCHTVTPAIVSFSLNDFHQTALFFDQKLFEAYRLHHTNLIPRELVIFYFIVIQKIDLTTQIRSKCRRTVNV